MSALSMKAMVEWDSLLEEIGRDTSRQQSMMSENELRIMSFNLNERLKLAKARAGMQEETKTVNHATPEQLAMQEKLERLRARS